MIGQIELHIITACAVLLALDPAKKLARQFKNWLDRRRFHAEHVRRLEERG